MMRDKTVREIVDATAAFYYLKGFEEGYCTELDDPDIGAQGGYLKGFKEGYVRGRRDGICGNRKRKKHDSGNKRGRKRDR